MNYKKLVEEFKLDCRKATEGLRDGLGKKHIRSDELDLTRLFIECFGYSEFDHYRSNSHYSTEQVLREAGPIMTTSFQNISQQFLSAVYQDAYDVPTQVFTPLIPTVKTTRRFERVPGVGHIGDEFDGVVDEGKEYANVGLSEDWVDTPQVLKRGKKAAITKETIIFEETGLVVARVSQLGDWLGVNKEKRAIDCVIDGNTTAHRYNWQGSVYASYQTTTPWINRSTSNSLTDYKSLDSARQVLMAITDPQTGEPQNLQVKHLIVAPENYASANVALAPEVSVATPGYATSANPVRGTIPNPMTKAMGITPDIVSSQLLKSRLTAASIATTGWFLGDIGAYAEYKEVWPDTFEQLGAMGAKDEFDRDVVQQFKASGMGAFRVKQPRKLLYASA